MAEANKLAAPLLIAGSALGLGAALWSALGVNQAVQQYGDAVAVVNGTPIPRAVFDTAIEGLAGAKRNPLTEAERREVLDRIIDEELLLRRAVELGLAETDPSSRKALVNAMLQFSIADSAKLEPTDEELRRFYTDRPKLVAAQPLLSVKGVSLPQSEGGRIAKLKAALAGGAAFDAAAKAVQAEPILLPGGPSIPAKIAEYAGATVRDTALALHKGEFAGPVQIGRRVFFVTVIDRFDSPPPPLEDVRDVVVDEWRKRKTEEAFETYVKSLRDRARIGYAADAPKAGTE